MLKSEILDISKSVSLDTLHFDDIDDAMIAKYPAVGIFHALRSLQNQKNGNELSQHFLQEAASRLTNRKQLFLFLQNLHEYEAKQTPIIPELETPTPEPIIENKEVEEFAESKIAVPEEEISTPEIEETTKVEEEIPTSEPIIENKEIQEIIKPEIAIPEEIILTPEIEETKKVGEEEIIQEPETLKEELEEITLSPIIEDKVIVEPIPEEKKVEKDIISKLDETFKTEKHTFIEWIKIFQNGNIPLKDLEKKPEAKSEKSIQKEEPIQVSKEDEKVEITEDMKYAEDLAQKSITFNWENATETLAKVYTKQGKKQKAIEVYKYLILKYPSKSSYFASQIENLES